MLKTETLAFLPVNFKNWFGMTWMMGKVGWPKWCHTMWAMKALYHKNLGRQAAVGCHLTDSIST